jgi:hypothetical protein
MAKIYKFELRGRPKGIFCPVLGFNFPPLFRIQNIVSREQALQYISNHEIKVSEEEAKDFWKDTAFPNRRIHYTMSDDKELLPELGDVEVAQIKGMPDTDGPSLVIRWHQNEERARAYIVVIYYAHPESEVNNWYTAFQQDGTNFRLEWFEPQFMVDDQGNIKHMDDDNDKE